jgi:amidase
VAVTDLVYRSAGELLDQLATRRLSALELLEAHVRRHEQVHQGINAVVALDLERARSRAREIDDARTRGADVGPLAGLPMTIKDGFDVHGLPAVAGNPAFAQRPAGCRDAVLVAKLRAAGAVIWGKTNVPLMLGDFQSYNAVYGTTNNPYDLTRTPGGSSGGAAAALAAGVTPLELGSDIGGSLRHPANWCGVYSLKPTWNVLPMRGHVPPPPGRYLVQDLEVAGPMARTASDLRALYAVLRADSPQPPRDVRGARIALWLDEPAFPVSNAVRSAVEHAANGLRAEGATVEAAALPFSARGLVENYLSLLYPIIGAGLPEAVYARFEQARTAQENSAAADLDPYGMTSMAVRATATFRAVARAMADRQALKDQLTEWFAQWDAILAPVSAVTAFTHRQDGPLPERSIDIDDISVPYMHLLDWPALATDLHLPALTAPATRTTAGLPVGVQVIGTWHDEDRLLDIASTLEHQTGGFTPPS